MNYDESSVVKVIQSVFGYKNFQNVVQKDAIAAIIEGSKAVCVSMPPGFGRSLCFQLPAILQKGKVTIIFSPKLSSIEKQIDFLRSKNINAYLLRRNLYLNKRKYILNDLTSISPTIVLLYATPDMATVTYFQKLVLLLRERKMLSYIVFNEAHCLSTLGYEYSPNYKALNMFDKLYGYVPQIAITTTVTNMVIKDICKLLKLKDPNIFKLNFQQINVYYDIWFLDLLSHPFEHLRNFIVKVLGLLDSTVRKVHKDCVIIYCREEATAELLKNKLTVFGLSTLTYHYKLNHSMKRSIENKWISGEACIITTTYNYGFIYKKLIRCTIYWTVPENISKYYRESAQTHVNNKQTYCRIYFSTKEYSSVKMAITNHKIMNDPEHIKQRLSEFDKFVSYCLSIKCRHVIVSNYFGHIIPPCKTYCDVCKNREIVETITFNYVMLSKNTAGVEYNICEISGDLLDEQTHIDSNINNEKELADGTNNNSEELEVIYVGPTTTKRNDKSLINKQKLSSIESSSLVTQLSKLKFTQIRTKNAVKSKQNDKNMSEFTITQSAINRNNLNKELAALKSTTSKRGTIKDSLNKTNYVQTTNKQTVLPNKSTDEILKNTTATKLQDRKSRKRDLVIDTYVENSKSKKRKLDYDNKAIIEIEKTKGRKIGVSPDRGAVHVKNDAKENKARDQKLIEHLMNKYNLNKQSITLELREKKN